MIQCDSNPRKHRTRDRGRHEDRDRYVGTERDRDSSRVTDRYKIMKLDCANFLSARCNQVYIMKKT